MRISDEELRRCHYAPVYGHCVLQEGHAGHCVVNERHPEWEKDRSELLAARALFHWIDNPQAYGADINKVVGQVRAYLTTSGRGRRMEVKSEQETWTDSN